jgi:hypothetical protein
METNTKPNRRAPGRTLILAAVVALPVTGALLLVALGAGAEPIDNFAMKPYRAGWYSNSQAGKLLTCAATCRAKASASTEHEPSAVPPTRRAFVCRVQGEPSGELRTFLYGNQFDDRAACYTVGLDLKGSYSDKYLCLCVDPEKKR